MSAPVPLGPGYKAELKSLFDKQAVMRSIGASLTRVEPGEVEIELPVSGHILQHNGFVHAGIIATIADSACGCAAFTLMAPGHNVLTAEFKQNLLSPAQGERLVATGKVIRAGRTLTVAQAEVHAEASGQRKLVALMTATLIAVKEKD